jgi:hypothetical protein
MKWRADRHCLFAFTFSMLHDAEPEASANRRLPVFHSLGSDLHTESAQLFEIMP